MSAVLWHVPLAGACAVCGQPATRLEVHRDFRLVYHARGRRPCELGNPLEEEKEAPRGVYIFPRSA